MIDLKEYYSSRVDEQKHELKELETKLIFSSLIRGIIFLGTAFACYYFYPSSAPLLTSLAIGVTLFLILISRHTDLKYSKAKTKALLDLNIRELEVMGRDFSGLEDGVEFTRTDHDYALDIDLFGKGSIYQYTNRTELLEGGRSLARILCANEPQGIQFKQEGLKELGKRPDWCQEFAAIARLVDTKASDQSIFDWLSSYRPFVPNVMRIIPWIFSVLSALIIFGFAVDMVAGLQLGLWFGIGLMLTGLYLKKVNILSKYTSQAQSTFEEYKKLVTIIEGADFKSSYLQELRSPLIGKEMRTSELLTRFAKMLGSLDQRNNMLFGILGNGFLLWDIRCAYRIEQWIAEHGSKVEDWFRAIADFDAHVSLGIFIFNHPEYVFPLIDPDAKQVLIAEDAGHPLIDPTKSVGNPIEIGKEQFHIITGANMAGKSTYLRTVSLQIVMANIGLPVCASSCLYSPIKLITSMRSTDSLTDDTSYFFSELKRLRYIIDRLEEDRYFIILDEILKGTNSTDKAIGSRKFVKRLVASGSTGIIATHDLSLCELGDELTQVENYYLDAEIIDDELSFDYTLKKGICQNMNASFLLEKMGLV